MQAPETPKSCPICGCYQTADSRFHEARCTDPSHWLAAGRIAPTDYYAMAQIFAPDRLELPGSPLVIPLPEGGT